MSHTITFPPAPPVTAMPLPMLMHAHVTGPACHPKVAARSRVFTTFFFHLIENKPRTGKAHGQDVRTSRRAAAGLENGSNTSLCPETVTYKMNVEKTNHHVHNNANVKTFSARFSNVFSSLTFGCVRCKKKKLNN